MNASYFFYRLNVRPIALLVGAFGLFSTTAIAQFSQPGQLDTAFNFGKAHAFFSDPSNPMPGQGATSHAGSAAVNAIAQLPDGKLVVGGTFTQFNGINRRYLARLDTNGRVDGPFNTSNGANNSVTDLAVQTDGRLVIVGFFTSYAGITRNSVARIDTNGSLDPTFNPGSGANGPANKVLIQPDGRVIIAGTFTQYNGVAVARVIRLNPNGSRDTTFNVGAGPNSSVSSMVLQADGKILVGGSFTTFNGFTRSGLVRLNANGSLDTTYLQNGPGTVGDVSGIVLQPDGKAMICGGFTFFNGISRRRMARINENGTLDMSFNPGTGADQPVVALTRLTNGKYLFAGLFSSVNGIGRNKLVVLNNDGSVDASFILPDVSDFSFSIFCVQTNGRIVKGGNFTTINGLVKGGICRFMTDGSDDSSFNAPTGVENDLQTIELQPDGKVLIGGYFRNTNGIRTPYLDRLNPDGTTDSTFNTGLGPNDWVLDIKMQPDGRILIAGRFNEYNGEPRNGLARLLPNGSLDMTFVPANMFGPVIYSVALQADGKILIGGMFTSVANVSRSRIARLNADGSLDTTFNPGTGASHTNFIIKVNAIAIQRDGKSIVGGEFTSFNGLPRNRIVRLNTNGSVDGTFTIGSGFPNEVNRILIQPDGKIIVSGQFVQFNGINKNVLVRLNQNGSLDAPFNAGTGPDWIVHTLGLQPDGKILIGGTFTLYDGQSRPRVARLNANGSLDTTFNPATGANAAVWSSALQPNGKWLIGGDFTVYNGIFRSRIARVTAYPCTTQVTNNTSASSICLGQSKTLTGTPGGVWKITYGSGTISGNTFTATGSTGLVSIYNDLGGCLSPLVTFQVDSLPPLPVLPPIPAVCAGDSAVITPLAGGASYRFYSTNTGGSPMLNGDGVNSFTTPALSSTTTYYVSSLSAAGCESNSRTALTVTVIPLPAVQIVQQGNTLVGNLNVGSFQWYLDSVAISGANASTFIPLQSGIYTLRVTNAQGCMGASNAINVVMTSLDDQQKAQINWATYPVPFNNELTIEAEHSFSYTLLDLRGSVLLSGKTDHPEIAISTSHLASGVYMLRLEVNGQSALRKVVKQ